MQLYSKDTWANLNRNKRPINISIFYDIKKHYLRKHLNTNDVVLEIGAGFGEFTEEILKACRKLVVSDISEEQLEFNKNKTGNSVHSSKIQEWCIADVCDLSAFSNQTFDKIVCLGGPLSYVLEKREKAVQEIHRVLKQNGVAIIGVMNLWGTIKALSNYYLTLPDEILREIIETGDTVNSFLIDQGLHKLHLFTYESINEILLKNSFSLIETTTTNFISLDGNSHEMNYDNLLKMEIEVCCKPCSFNSGDHLIVIAKKE